MESTKRQTTTTVEKWREKLEKPMDTSEEKSMAWQINRHRHGCVKREKIVSLLTVSQKQRHKNQMHKGQER